MTRIGLGRSRSVGMALSAAGALWLLACAGLPALAGDDGAAPIWDSLGSVLNFGSGESQPDINYRDHAKLVVPPKMDLPPPAPPATAGVADWPRDPDVARWNKQQAEKKANKTFNAKRDGHTPIDPKTVVTTNYTSGLGPSARKCAAGPGQSCDSASSPSLNWNPLTWVGIQKKPVTVLGAEPPRMSLTDPPQGYRDPAEGVGVKVDSN